MEKCSLVGASVHVCIMSAYRVQDLRACACLVEGKSQAGKSGR